MAYTSSQNPPNTATYGPQGAANYFGTWPTTSTSGAMYWDAARQQMVYYNNQPPVPGGGILALPPTAPPTKAPPKGPSAADVAAKAARDAAAAQKAAQAKADAEAAAAKKRAGESYLARAGNLEGQIEALKYALGAEGFEKNLNQNLADILSSYETGIGLLKETHAGKARGFLGSAEDTEKATAQQAGSTFENLVRERQDTLNNVLLQGAGETDALRAMVMAARNYRDNLSEGNRAYFDTMRTVGTGINELNMDTRTAMQNSYRGLESERDRLWQDFYNKRSETYTQLGNTYGQQADYYLSAKENEVGTGGKEETTKQSANEAFMNAAREVGKSYVQQGTPQWLQEWKGIEAPQARQANTDLAAAVTFEPLGNPEGASLRSW